MVALAIAGSMVACGDSKDKPATQTAAKVNREEITVHQINAVLQKQRGVTPEQTDQASRRALERLIDQELALQKAAEMKVDRDPRVLQAIEASRRDIVARAYAERIGEGAPKPTPAEIKKYYDDNPALFKERRVYQLQELAIEAVPDQVDTLRAKLQAAKSISEFVDFLRAKDFKFTANQAVRGAEQLPLAALPELAKLKDGQVLLNPTSTGAQVVVLASSRAQPVDEKQAERAIEQFLLNERKRKLVADDLKALRDSAKIDYVGKFVAALPDVPDKINVPTPPDGAAPAAPSVADAAVKPASGVDAASISKGLGLK